MRRAVRWVSILSVVVVLAGASAGLWYLNALRVVHKSPNAQFEITQGQSTTEIVSRLQQDGFIDNTLPVLLYIRLHHSVFLAGTFTLPDHYTTVQLIDTFSKEDKRETKLVIPEGWSKEQIAQELDERGLDGPAFLREATSAEGTLFPDTYSIDARTTAKDIFERMRTRYDQQTATVHPNRNELILASIVEREAVGDSDRPVIAGIYRNRLRIGMRLEADPTVQYAKYTDIGPPPLKDGKKNYWAPITKTDYSGVKSPYNTYLNGGLPPAPICNPGLKSIEAAIRPGSSDAFYFFHTKDGQLITSRTLDEHNINKAKYLR